jgi:hypothetical protein
MIVAYPILQNPRGNPGDEERSKKNEDISAHFYRF